jgi:hypothetical protein
MLIKPGDEQVKTDQILLEHLWLIHSNISHFSIRVLSIIGMIEMLNNLQKLRNNYGYTLHNFFYTELFFKNREFGRNLPLQSFLDAFWPFF